MLRRSFMKFMGVSPVIVPMFSGLMERDGKTIDRPPFRDATQCTVFLYGRVEMAGKLYALKQREEFLKRLDQEIEVLKRDFIRHYDEINAGKRPVWIKEDGTPHKYLHDLI